MGFWHKDGLEEPPSIMNLADVPNFLKGRNGLVQNRKFLWPILDLLDCNRRGVASVDHTFVILHRDKYPTVVEDWPMFLNQYIDAVLKSLVEVRQVQILAKIVVMKGLVVPKQKEQIDNVERRRRLFNLLEYRSAINVVKENVELLGLVREAPALTRS